MIDNLFIVESPLQALVAVELSLQFSDQKNGIIYRLSGKGRERNDNQILKVIERGHWLFSRQATFSTSGGLAYHLSVRSFTLNLKKEFYGSVRNCFIGEFRSQWMHLARLSIAPEKYVLMDDGAATLTAKRQYIDKGIYHPVNIFSSASTLKNLVKNILYFGLFDKAQEEVPLVFASAFLKKESEFKVDFSYLKEQVVKKSVQQDMPGKAYFFGSKYSEAGIISRDYELKFLASVVNHYKEKGLDLVYCAHRDESAGKLKQIENLGDVDILLPDLPAEIFVLEQHNAVYEIGAAYSSILNNLNIIFPEKSFSSFRLDPCEIRYENRDSINHCYDHIKEKKIPVICF